MTLRWMCGLMLALTQLTSAQPAPGQAPSVPPSSQIAGYSSANSPVESDWEKKFRDGISPANIRENMRRLSARPHHVGSPYDKDNAEWILSKFKEWGFDAKIESFNVLFPTPKVRVVEMLQPTRFQAKLQEPVAGSRSHQRPDRRATPHLQRLFRRWRRDRPAGVCELRQSRRL